MEDLQERNEKIRADMRAKRPILEIMAEYKISYSRVYQINKPDNQREQKKRARELIGKSREIMQEEHDRKIAAIIAKGIDA